MSGRRGTGRGSSIRPIVALTGKIPGRVGESSPNSNDPPVRRTGMMPPPIRQGYDCPVGSAGWLCYRGFDRKPKKPIAEPAPSRRQPKTKVAERTFMEREAMEFDVVIVGAGPSGPGRGDPPAPTGGRERPRSLGVRYRKRLGTGGSYSLGRGVRTACPGRTDPRLERQGGAADDAGPR